MRTLLILSAIALLLAPMQTAMAAGCGAAPPAPKLPVGCRGMVPTCVCDAQGNCHWEFLCTRE
jgi:hypothetical protein